MAQIQVEQPLLPLQDGGLSAAEEAGRRGLLDLRSSVFRANFRDYMKGSFVSGLTVDDHF